MPYESVEIRLELLRDIGAGLTKRETVKHLAEKFGITEAGAYWHFKNKDKWLDSYTSFDKDAVFEIKARFNYIYREASFQYLHSQNDNARVGYLRVMLEANSQNAEFLPKDAKDGNADVTVSWRDTPQVDWNKLSEQQRETVREAFRIINDPLLKCDKTPNEISRSMH